MKISPQNKISQQVPDRWSWHYQRLQSFRDHLLDNRAIQIAEVSQPLETHSMDLADSATDEFDHDMALGILSHQQEALYEVDAAIRRILDGKYGICEETGKRIPSARLRAVPRTRYIREVEARMEQEGLVKQPHLGAVSSIQTSGPRALSEMEDLEKELLPSEVVRHMRQVNIEAIESGADTGFATAESTQL